MTDYKVTGVHQINGWLWSKLKDFEYAPGKKAFDAYGPGAMDVVPFIPAQQQAEFTNIAGGAPFIVYNYVINPFTEFYQKREQGAYAIYDSNIARLRGVHLYLVDLLSREDMSAADVNRWLAVDDAGLPNGTPWDFGSISLAGAVGPDEFAQEGGRQGATISITYTYTHDLDANGMRL